MIRPATSVPPLENGDRATRPEFERRYTHSPSDQKAELIEGTVYLMASPLRFQQHAEPHANIIGWLWTYQVTIPNVRIGIEPTVRLDLENEPRPDAVLFWEESAQGQAQLTADDYIEGAPELIVEIAASSSALDLHGKKRAYQRNGVKEYLVWCIYENSLNWFSLEAGEYILQQPDEKGIIKSRVFPGLWLAVNELLAGNMSAVLETLNQGKQQITNE